LSEENVLQLAELSKKEQELITSRDTLNQEARSLANERNAMNKEVTELVEKAKTAQHTRDECNKDVAELKTKKEEAEAQVEKAQKEVDALGPIKKEEEKPQKVRRGPPIRVLKQRLKAAEWRLQTTVMTRDSEKALVEEIETLQATLDDARDNLSEHERRMQIENNLRRAYNNLDRVQSRYRTLVRKSQKYHIDMINLWKDVDTKKKEADEKHREFIEKKTSADTVHGEIQSIRGDTKSLRDKVHDSRRQRQHEKEQVVKELREEKTKLAYGKFKEGERLTMEEFTLLVEKGLL
jgi:uncharacterized coiled-coil DUF342 family protein